MAGKKSKTSENKITLCIGITAPIGVDINHIENCLKEEINRLNLDVTITVDKITDLDAFNRTADLTGYEKYEQRMNIGDEEREQNGNDILVERVCENINNGIHLIHQLKTPEECDFLRDKFSKEKKIPTFILSVFDTLENRIQFLNKKTRKQSDTQNLIERDEKDSLKSNGQNVRDSFVLADFFIDASKKSTITQQVSRIVKAIFCYPHLSPTKDEFGMFLAEGAALRSRDLSRQVGAAILNSSGSVLALGCNETPKAFGGTYWENDDPDHRDFVYGIDSSYEYRNQIVQEFLEALSNAENISAETKAFLETQSSEEELLKFIGSNKDLFKGTRVMNLIEFGRSIHGEVSAISEAAKLGIAIQGATMYVTVFPCHLCSRYIIASGIAKIVFIEPYPKSLTTDLYGSEIALSPTCECNDKIIMNPFIGIAPRIYRRVFIYDRHIMSDKKQPNAKVTNWVPNLNKWIL